MPDTVILDAGPLGMISHPRPTSEIVVWLVNLVTAGVWSTPSDPFLASVFLRH